MATATAAAAATSHSTNGRARTGATDGRRARVGAHVIDRRRRLRVSKAQDLVIERMAGTLRGGRLDVDVDGQRHARPSLASILGELEDVQILLLLSGGLRKRLRLKNDDLRRRDRSNTISRRGVEPRALGRVPPAHREHCRQDGQRSWGNVAGAILSTLD